MGNIQLEMANRVVTWRQTLCDCFDIPRPYPLAESILCSITLMTEMAISEGTVFVLHVTLVGYDNICSCARSLPGRDPNNSIHR